MRSGVTPGREGMSKGTVPQSYLGRARPEQPRPGGGGGSGGGPRGPRRPGGGRGNEYRGRKVRPRWGRILGVSAIALVVLIAAGTLGAWAYAKSLDSKLNRTDAFAGLTDGRPTKTVSGAQNILLLGSDMRESWKKNHTMAARTDTIMLAHIDADHQHAYIISIPRDTYVYIPKVGNSQYGDTWDKINAAFAWGGTPMMVKTVETFTGVRIDHVAIINFNGFKEVTDALGGVNMYVDQTITSIHTHHVFTKGWHHFDGAQALDYCRQREQFPDGDFTRQKHQHQFLMQLMKKAASTGTLTNPVKLNNFLKAVTKAIVVDKDFDLVSEAIQFRSLRSDDVTFLTSPWSGYATENGESVVRADKPKALSLYKAVENDTVAEWLKKNPQK